MHPVVLINRTPTGASFRYTRFAPERKVRGDSTHVVETPPAKASEAVYALPPDDVEWLRKDPEGFFK